MSCDGAAPGGGRGPGRVIGRPDADGPRPRPGHGSAPPGQQQPRQQQRSGDRATQRPLLNLPVTELSKSKRAAGGAGPRRGRAAGPLPPSSLVSSHGLANRPRCRAARAGGGCWGPRCRLAGWPSLSTDSLRQDALHFRRSCVCWPRGRGHGVNAARYGGVATPPGSSDGFLASLHILLRVGRAMSG